MKYFVDTEFSERGHVYPIQLISIGIACQDGRSLYAENYECDWGGCNEWVKANVLPRLNGPRSTIAIIRDSIRDFVGGDAPEFWGHYCDYDWVVFCQIFGSMVDLPEGWPMYCNDLKQWAHQLGNPKLPEQKSTEHNALNDARWNLEAWNFLNEMAGTK